MLLKPKCINNNLLVNIFVTCSSNNTIINVSTLKNHILFNGSCGFVNVKKGKKSIFYASQNMAIILGKRITLLGFKYAYIKLRGFGNGRYSAVKGFNISGLIILNIFDKTMVPFNGSKVSKNRKI